METIDRLILFIDKLIENKEIRHISEFEKKCGLYYGYIFNRKRGKGTLDSKMMEKISNAYPSLNLKWLITGKEGMFYINPYRKAYEAAMEQIEALNEILKSK